MVTDRDIFEAEAMQRDKAERDRVAEQQQQTDFEFVLSDERGRRFICDLLVEAGVYRQPFSGNAEQTAFNCGIKQLGLNILARLIETHPAIYMQMIKENSNE